MPPPGLPPGTLVVGVPLAFVNLYEVSLVDGYDMVRLAFGATKSLAGSLSPWSLPEAFTRPPSQS